MKDVGAFYVPTLIMVLGLVTVTAAIDPITNVACVPRCSQIASPASQSRT